MFTNQEVAFLAEFEKVCMPLAYTLDFFQGDNKNSLLGCLLPHITRLKLHLRSTLDGQHGSLTYTREIVQALLERVSIRFDPFFEDHDYQMASCSHPSFRLQWVNMWDPARKEELRDRLVAEVAEHMRNNDNNQEKTTEKTTVTPQTQVVYDEDSDDAGFYRMMSTYSDPISTVRPRVTVTEKARNLVESWESLKANYSATGIFTDADFLDNSALMDIFMSKNTGVVSSAACERFFSQGKDTLAAKRLSMTGTTFEGLMFLRGNAHLWCVPQVQRRRDNLGLKPHPLVEKWSQK